MNYSSTDHINLNNPTTFTAFYNNYYTRIAHFAQRFVPDGAAAADITSETFIKLWNLRADFTTLQTAEAFLHITVRNACLNYLKRDKKRQEIQDNLIATLEEQQVADVLKRDINTELLELIYQEVEKLPKKYHKVFELSFIQGWKNEEVAGFLNISNQTVRTYKKEMLQLLRLVFESKSLLLALIWVLEKENL